jgi:selenocysteine lyase/cysteine desulfurase
MQRRQFLIGTGVSVGIAPLIGGCSGGSGPPAASSPAATPWRAPATWPELKAAFDVAPGLAHMSSFFLASHPRPVRDAIERHRRELDRNPFHYIEDNLATFESATRQAAGDYMGVRPDDLAMTDSTTMGLGTVYGGLRLRAGQEILSTPHDHIVTTLSCQFRAERTGAPFRQVALYDDPARADVTTIVDRLAAAVKPETRILAITWVHSGTGVKLPVRAIADRVAKLNAGRGADDRLLLCVDGVHGFGIEDVSIADLGCDFFMAGCHKWIFGPRGTGVVYGRPDAWPHTSPTIPSFDPAWRTGGLADMPPAALMTPGGFHSFEHRWALAEAFRFHLALGKPTVAARIHDLNRVAKRELARMPKVKVATPQSDDLSAGIICFDVDGLTPRQVERRLREKDIVASVTPSFYTPPHARVAPSLLTVEQDLEATLRAIRSL